MEPLSLARGCRGFIRGGAHAEAEIGGPQWVFGLSDYDIDADGTIYAFAHGPEGARLLALGSGEASP